jgi:RNA polymerase sigma factor (sigma-70 family)
MQSKYGIPSDAVDRMLAGDESHLPQLIDSLNSFSRGYAINYRLNKEAAEDAVQETMAHLYSKGLNTFYPGAESDPWLRKIVMNKVRDFRRKEKRHTKIHLDNKVDNNPENPPHLTLIEDEKAEDPTNLQDPKTIEDLEAVLNHVTSQEFRGLRQQAFYLTQIAGKTHKEAYEILGIPLGSVKSGISDTRKDLYEKFPEIRKRLSA